MLDRRLDYISAFAQISDKARRAIVFAKQFAQRFNRSKHFFKAAWISHINGNLLFIELPGECFELRRGRNQNDLRLQRNDALDARLHRVANLGNVLRVRWVVTIRGIANQSIAGADRVNDLGEIRSERDNAIDAQRKTDAAACLIDDFARGFFQRGRIVIRRE